MEYFHNKIIIRYNHTFLLYHLFLQKQKKVFLIKKTPLHLNINKLWIKDYLSRISKLEFILLNSGTIFFILETISSLSKNLEIPINSSISMCRVSYSS